MLDNDINMAWVGVRWFELFWCTDGGHAALLVVFHVQSRFAEKFSVSVNMEPLLLYHIPGSGVMCRQQILKLHFCPKPVMISVIYFFLKDTFSYQTEIYNSIWSFISNLKRGIKLSHHYLFIIACTTSKLSKQESNFYRGFRFVHLCIMKNQNQNGINLSKF